LLSGNRRGEKEVLVRTLNRDHDRKRRSRGGGVGETYYNFSEPRKRKEGDEVMRAAEAPRKRHTKNVKARGVIGRSNQLKL